MKNIKTLVPDIYKVLSDGTNIKEENLKHFSSRLEEMLREKLQVGYNDKSPALRMSNFGMPCQRELWYKINRPDAAQPLEPWVIFKFMYGHVLEELVLFLAKEAGHTVTGEQDELEINGLVGHRDAVIDGVLVDAKSANARGFIKFREHLLESDDPFGYLDQLGLYLAASRKDNLVEVKGEAAFLAIDKEMGRLVLDTYRFKKKVEDYEQEISRTRAMLAEPHPPRRPYLPRADGKSGNMVLDTKCSYCPYKHMCWSDANSGQGLIQYNYSNGPKWFTRIEKEPRVEKEISHKEEGWPE